MAKPHNKILRGKEAGKDCQHWYDWVQSANRLRRSGKWQGSRTKTKPGVQWVPWNFLHMDHKKMGTWNYMLKEAENGEAGTGN